jgi:hypothetical protein
MEHQGGQDRGSKEQVLKVQETSLLLGGHQQSVKEPPNGGDFKKHYNQLSIKDKGRDQQVFQCTGIVMEVSWQIAIVRWIVWRLSFRTTIACKLPSKYLTDLPDDMNHCPIMTSIHVSVCLSVSACLVFSLYSLSLQRLVSIYSHHSFKIPPSTLLLSLSG